MKTVTILGATGSIGQNALSVCRVGGYKIAALAANKNISALEAAVREFSVPLCAVFDETAAKDLRVRLKDTDTKVLSGEEGVCEAAAARADICLNAIVGIAGLKPTLSAIAAGRTLALANKESLVTGGDIVKAEAARRGVDIIPVDSEHSAIFQCLRGVPNGALQKIILTASGGPFYGKTKEQLSSVTAADALRHPNWDMGAKITIDSATLMNKGFEVIEAVHLFGVRVEDIEVLVHRQSIVHSAVELCDGAVIAQLGVPDMRLPIQYAFTFPERSPCPGGRLSLCDIGALTFDKPDYDTFECLPLCIEAIKEGGLAPAAVNGANEEAVSLFLAGKIGFLDIPRLVRAAFDRRVKKPVFDINDIFAADKAARQTVGSLCG